MEYQPMTDWSESSSSTPVDIESISTGVEELDSDQSVIGYRLDID